MKNDVKIFVGIGLLTIVLVLGSVYALSKMLRSSNTAISVDSSILIKENSHQKGSKEARVTIVEFSDFQCPACAGVEPEIQKLLAQYPDQINFYYRQFPLDNIHKNARLAAYVAESAGNQNKFWEMHDLLFEKQAEWANSTDALSIFSSYAQKIDLNLEKFKADVDSQEIKDRVATDIADANRAKINSTPTFFINGTPVVGFGSPEFNQLLKEALALN